MKIHDLSITIDENCMACGTPWHVHVKLEHLGKINEVGRNTHSIFLGSHTGTHMDAPLHFYDGRKGIDAANLESICGPCKVVDMSFVKAGAEITIEDIKNLEICERMLFRFGWYKHWQKDDFYKCFPFFSVEAAEYLISKGLRVIALDTPSPDNGNAIGEKDDSPVHKLFLKNDVTIIEYLTETDALEAGKVYNLFALPLKIRDCDGAPARVIMTED